MIAMTTLGATSGLPESYVKRAFLLQYNLILLFAAVLFSLALASPWPLLVGGILEALWLGAGSNLASVRAYLDRAPTPAASVVPGPSSSRRDALEPAYASRLAAMEFAVDDLRKLALALDAASLRHVSERFDALVQTFTELCEAHQRLSRYVAGTPEAGILTEIERLKRDYAQEKDPGLRLAIRQSMSIEQRRLDQLAQLESSLRTASIRMQSLERATESLRSQAQVLGLNQQLLQEVDALCRDVGADSLAIPISPEIARAVLGVSRH